MKGQCRQFRMVYRKNRQRPTIGNRQPQNNTQEYSGTRRRPGLSFWPSRFSYYSLIVFCETRDPLSRVGGVGGVGRHFKEERASFSMYPETQDN